MQVVILIYFLVTLIVCLLKFKKIKNLREYSVGTGQFSVLVLAATIFSTHVNANNTIGNIGRIYQTELLYAIPLLLSPLFWLITYYVFAKNIFRFKDCLSLSDIMGKLYSWPGRYITFFITIIRGIGVLSIQAIAIGHLCQHFTIFSYTTGMIIVMGFLALYSCLGGVRLVAFTDVVQFLVFFIVFPIFAGIVMKESGGPSALIKQISHASLDFLYKPKAIIQFLSISFYILLPAAAAPYIQRLLMGKDIKQLRSTFILLMILAFVFSLTIAIIGLSIKAGFPSLNPERSLYEVLAQKTPLAIYLATALGLLSVIMSSADSWLNAVSVIIASDVMLLFNKNAAQKPAGLLFARITTLILSALSVIVAILAPKIIQIFSFIINFYYPIILPPLTAGFFGYKITQRSFLIGVCFGCIFTGVGYFIVGEFGFVSMTFGTILNAVGIMLAENITKLKLLIGYDVNIKKSCDS